MCPASSPAASPVPQNRSARTSPVMAPPVSCAARAHQRGAVRARGGQPQQAAQWHHVAIHGDAVAGGQRHVQRAARAFVAVRAAGEKHIAGIAGQQFGHAGRVGIGPGADGGHADVGLLQLTLLHQPAADGAIGMAILVGVGDPQLTAIGQLDAARALDLQELQVHRAGQPGQYGCLDAVRGDPRGIVIRLEHAPFHASTQALALEFGIKTLELDADHVVGHTVHRHRRLGGAGEAAGIDRLVVTGDQAIGPVATGAQGIDVEIRLQELADGGRRGGNLGGRGAGGCPVGLCLQARAGTAPGGEAGLQIGVRDGGQCVPTRLCVGAGGHGCWR